MAEALIFAQTIEGLLRALGTLSHEDLDALRALGLDATKPLLPAYRLELFIALMDWAGARVAPGRTSLEQTRELGRRFMDAYQQTLIGRAMVAGMRVIGPWRTLQRLTHKFRTGNNFSETALTRHGEREAELWCNQVSRPGWYLGLLSRGLEQAGAVDVTVELLSCDDSGGRFRIRWKE